MPPIICISEGMASSNDDPGYTTKFNDGMYVDLVTKLEKIWENAVLQIATALAINDKSLKCITEESRAGVWKLLFCILFLSSLTFWKEISALTVFFLFLLFILVLFFPGNYILQ